MWARRPAKHEATHDDEKRAVRPSPPPPAALVPLLTQWRDVARQGTGAARAAGRGFGRQTRGPTPRSRRKMPRAPTLTPRHPPSQATFTLGFLLACAYHVAQMDPSGLPSAVVAGVPGPVWRTWDILCAQWLLGRSFGHAVGASHAVTIALTNVAFPAAVLALAHAASASGGALSLAACSRALLGTVAAATAAKLGLEGTHTLPPVPGHRARNAGFRILTGLAVFPLPELAPSTYWFFHSLWHIFMGWGLHELYLALEGEPPAVSGLGPRCGR